ncbi:hypothetical protein AOLI_G00305220 [Acnodon oligacanthus]
MDKSSGDQQACTIFEQIMLFEWVSMEVIPGSTLDLEDRNFLAWSQACIRVLTGFQIPPPVTSTGSVFSLRLTSDFAVSAHGFKIYYEDYRLET